MARVTQMFATTMRPPPVLITAVALMAALHSAPAAAEPRPEHAAAAAVVQRFTDTMLDVLRHAEEWGYEGRLQRLRPVMDETFDFGFMAEKAIGRHWHALDEASRKLWLDTFTEFMGANYAGRLNKHTGQRFETLGSDDAPSSTVVIRTRVIDPAADNVDVSYRLHRTAGGWRVIDIYLKGTVSELALRRADYAAVLKKNGFDALVASVKSKIADLKAGKIA